MYTDTQISPRLDDLPDFFSAEELSRLLGISRATAYRRAEDGEIPCLKIGKRIIFSRTHLLRWLDHAVDREAQ